MQDHKQWNVSTQHIFSTVHSIELEIVFCCLFRLFEHLDPMEFKQQQTTLETHSFILLQNFRFQASQIKMQSTFSRLLIQPQKDSDGERDRAREK